MTRSPFRRCASFGYAEGLRYDPAIATKERYRLAEIPSLQRRHRTATQLSGIDLCSKVETEAPNRAAPQQQIQELIALALREMRFSWLFTSCSDHAGTLQQGTGSICCFPKRGNRRRGDPVVVGSKRKPSFGSSPLLPLPLLPLPLLPLPLLPLPLLPLPLLLSPLSLSPLLPYPHLHAPSAKRAQQLTGDWVPK